MIKEILIRKIENCSNQALLLTLFQILSNTEKHQNEVLLNGPNSDREKIIGLAC